jgi:16S rRNA (adenine1518-N6/adenine1519-N6)-dimethyltransferase
MERYGLRPTKSLGQCFLTDANTARKIVDLASPGPDDVVCEVGPGLGALTAQLASRAGRVVAVEKDARLIPALTEALGLTPGADATPDSDPAAGNVSVVHADFLEYDMSALPSGYKLVGNLPYYITTPIIIKAVTTPNAPALMVFMTQREVARRVCAPPGGKDYGAVSVAVQYRCEATYAMDVSREVFSPKPGVDSAVIVMRPEPGRLGTPVDEETFFAVVKAGFGQRRKMLRNSLSALVPEREALAEAFELAGVEETARAETLSVQKFIALSDAVHSARA